MNMQARFIIGQYLPGQSLLHQSHPVHKVTLLFIFCLLVFQLDQLAQLLAVGPLLLITFWLCKIPLSMILHGLKPLFVLMFITFFIHGLTDGDQSRLIFEWKFISISQTGLERGTFYCFRLLLVVIASALLTLTTSSVQITYAVERILRPLKIFRFPVAEFSLMLSISLRFIPVLMEEFQKLVMAQSARGASLVRGSIKQRFYSFSSLLVPLFNSALDRADQLAIAMEVRGFNPDSPRTSVHEYKFGTSDLLVASTIATWFFCINQIF
tara:strand:- start:191 stop:994 length:804 start_codon:yes stop_codon:yes gene_type:complete